MFVRWKCDQATIQIGLLHIGWFSMKQVTLTCQIGWFLQCHKSIFHTRENFNHLAGKTLLFSAGESLEVYRATLGHKVFQYYHIEMSANYSIITLQLKHLFQPNITQFQACHSFRPNSETDVFYHPRFGLIRCIATLQHVSRGPGDILWPNCEFQIRRGEEILIDYKYNLASAPAWFKVTFVRLQDLILEDSGSYCKIHRSSGPIIDY